MSEILDGQDEIRRRDRQGMLTILEQLDQHLGQAFEIGLRSHISPLPEHVQNILVCGLGGSAIGGDFLRAYLGPDLKIPFQVHRNYSVPGFVDDSTLALICSYSGNTEEVISAFNAAQEAGCSVICVSTGGKLETLASQSGCPLIKIPDGLPPRTAWAYSTIPLLVLLSRMELISDRSEEIRESLTWVVNRNSVYGLEVPFRENEAKKLAADVYGKMPIVYGSQDRLEVVARRWCGQFSENGKQLAYSSILPEMNHNEIGGWKHPDSVLQQLVPIFLRDREDHPRVQIRAEITRDTIAQQTVSCLEFWSEGEGWLQRLLSLILLGDYTSVYLGFLNDENPTPVEAIEGLKEKLKTCGS